MRRPSFFARSRPSLISAKIVVRPTPVVFETVSMEYATYWGGRRGPGASTVAFPSALTDAKLGGRPSPYGDFWSVGMGGILFSERLLNFSEHVRTVSRAWGFSMPLEQKSARHKNIP